MLALPISNSWGWSYNNQDAGNLQPGTTVTPGASNAEGSATSIATSSNIANDVDYVRLIITGGAVSGQAKNQLLDFGWDPAGGTSYTWFFQNLVCGGSFSAIGTIGQHYHFPVQIPAGSQVAVRAQGSNATAGTIRVYAEFYGKPSRPELWRSAHYAETIGTITNSNGVSFTPGNAAWGSWASLGSTTKPLFWWQLGVQIDNSSTSGHETHIELGVGDGTNFHIIGHTRLYSNTSESIHTSPIISPYWEVPAGGTLYVRGNNSAAPVSGYNAVALGFGG